MTEDEKDLLRLALGILSGRVRCSEIPAWQLDKLGFAYRPSQESMLECVEDIVFDAICKALEHRSVAQNKE